MRAETLALIAAAALAGCTASAPQPVAAPPVQVPLDASYDWHVLLVAPFGSVLKDIPLTLHEVLLFHDPKSVSPGDEAECFAADGEVPRFIDRSPDEYTLCFTHDRLSRIQVVVRLPEDQAAQIFADACGLWMKRASAPSSNLCEGSEAAVAFRGRLEDDPENAGSLLSVELAAPDER
jgi:hypothetical protein